MTQILLLLQLAVSLLISAQSGTQAQKDMAMSFATQSIQVAQQYVQSQSQTQQTNTGSKEITNQQTMPAQVAPPSTSQSQTQTSPVAPSCTLTAIRPNYDENYNTEITWTSVGLIEPVLGHLVAWYVNPKPLNLCPVGYESNTCAIDLGTAYLNKPQGSRTSFYYPHYKLDFGNGVTCSADLQNQNTQTTPQVEPLTFTQTPKLVWKNLNAGNDGDPVWALSYITWTTNRTSTLVISPVKPDASGWTTAGGAWESCGRANASHDINTNCLIKVVDGLGQTAEIMINTFVDKIEI